MLCLLRSGAGTSKVAALRSVDGTGDVKNFVTGDSDAAQHEGRNLAALLVACVTLVDTEPELSLRSALLADAVELFTLLAEAPGHALLDDVFGVEVSFYHNYEEVVASVAQLCQNVFRTGRLYTIPTATHGARVIARPIDNVESVRTHEAAELCCRNRVLRAAVALSATALIACARACGTSYAAHAIASAPGCAALTRRHTDCHSLPFFYIFVLSNPK